jgi:hypothetical protein
MSHKVSKSQAGYVSQGKKEHHCGPTHAFGGDRDGDRNYCKHFQQRKSLSETGQGCRLVLGEIERKGGCNLFTRALPRERELR